MSQNLKETAAQGNRLETLKNLRDRLSGTIDDSASARDIAALSKQLTEVLLQIDMIENNLPSGEVTILEQVFKLHAGTAETTKPTKRKPRAKD